MILIIIQLRLMARSKIKKSKRTLQKMLKILFNTEGDFPDLIQKCLTLKILVLPSQNF